jgi:hypothetical protein
MGMDQKVTFTAPGPPWPRVRDLLGDQGFPPQLRMIDGQLALPDEEPTEAWQELRVTTPGGMVTLRREPEGIRLVIWGNADARMRQAWNALAWAVAMLTGGTVETGTERLSADDFAGAAEMPNEMTDDAT